MPNQSRTVASNATGKKTPHARERARVLLAQQKRRQTRNRLLLRVGAPVLVAVLVVAVLVVVKANQKPAAATAAPTGAASTAVTAAVGGVPAATFNAIGAGAVKAAPTPITGPALTADGKPRILYIGAEYCPYCAAERWSMALALSRFGSFTGLGATSSATADIYPDTATLSFHGATYNSDLLSFTGVETTSNVPTAGGYAALDTPTAADAALITRYNPARTIPFVDLGNKYMINGASYDPAVLAGLTHEQIAAQLAVPTSEVAKAVDGSANVITAALCTLTDNKPTAVCSSPGVTNAATKLPR